MTHMDLQIRCKVDALALAQLAASLDHAGIDCAAGVSEEAMRVALHSYLLRQAHAEDRALTHAVADHDDETADGHDDDDNADALAATAGAGVMPAITCASSKVGSLSGKFSGHFAPV